MPDGLSLFFTSFKSTQVYQSCKCGDALRLARGVHHTRIRKTLIRTPLVGVYIIIVPGLDQLVLQVAFSNANARTNSQQQRENQ